MFSSDQLVAVACASAYFLVGQVRAASTEVRCSFALLANSEHWRRGLVGRLVQPSCNVRSTEFLQILDAHGWISITYPCFRRRILKRQAVPPLHGCASRHPHRSNVVPQPPNKLSNDSCVHLLGAPTAVRLVLRNEIPSCGALLLPVHGVFEHIRQALLQGH